MFKIDLLKKNPQLKLEVGSLVTKQMKKIFFLSLFLFSLSALKAQSCGVRTDGVYYAQLDSVTNIYIKFCDNDSVITTSSEADVETVIKYMKIENRAYILTGKYIVAQGQCMLQIKAKNEFGKVKMEGYINKNGLVLTVINKSDNTYRDFVFKFYPENSSGQG